MEQDLASSSNNYEHGDFAYPGAFQLFLDTNELMDFNDTGSFDNNNIENVCIQENLHEPLHETTSQSSPDDSFFDIDVNNLLFRGQDGPQNENTLHDHATNGPLLDDDLAIEQGENADIFVDSIDFLSGPIDVEQGEMGDNVSNSDQATYFLDDTINAEQDETGENANNLNQENAKALIVWPPLPVPFSCSCCQVLREMIHSNGTYVTKLEIHGRVGIIHHGILEMKSVADGLLVANPQMIDFCLRTMEDVRQFLMQYCQDRKHAGFIMMQDSLLAFYNTLCVGLELSTLEIMPPSNTETGIGETSLLVAENNPIVHSKPSLSTQRKRTRKLNRSQLDSYFNLPLTVASRKLGICTTAIKKICRKFGLQRWPYRKIRNVQSQIVRLEEGLRNKNEEESASDRAQIEALKRERDRIINAMIRHP